MDITITGATINARFEVYGKSGGLVAVAVAYTLDAKNSKGMTHGVELIRKNVDRAEWEAGSAVRKAHSTQGNRSLDAAITRAANYAKSECDPKWNEGIKGRTWKEVALATSTYTISATPYGWFSVHYPANIGTSQAGLVHSTHRTREQAQAVADELSRPSQGEALTIISPVAKAERPPYRYVPVTEHHSRVTLRGRHVADVRLGADRGWHLFGVEAPELELAWAGSMVAMAMLAPEVLAAQATAAPGCYVWGRLYLHKVELSQRAIAVAA